MRPIYLFFSLALLFLFALPADPFEGEGSGIDEIGEEEARRIHESFNIYSVLQSHQADLGETSAWDVAETILDESLKHSVDPMLVLAIMRVESGFRHNKISAQGARGLMQVRPIVAEELAGKWEFTREDQEDKLNDPVFNVRLGISYLGFLKDRFRDLRLALTAYHQGPGRVKDALARREKLSLEYAGRVLSTYRKYFQREWRSEKVPAETRNDPKFKKKDSASTQNRLSL